MRPPTKPESQLYQDESQLVMIPSYFVRVLLLLTAGCTAALTLKTPSSTSAILVSSTGPVGTACAMLFCITFIYLLVDVICNDFLPVRFRLPTARNYRWLAVSSISLAYFIFAVLALMPRTGPEGSWVLIVYYASVGAFGLWFSAYAKFKRYERQIAAKRYEHQQT